MRSGPRPQWRQPSSPRLSSRCGYQTQRGTSASDASTTSSRTPSALAQLEHRRLDDGERLHERPAGLEHDHLQRVELCVAAGDELAEPRQEDGVEVVGLPAAAEIEAADRPAAELLQAPAPFERGLDGLKPRLVAGLAAGPVNVQPDPLAGRQVAQRAHDLAERREVVQRHAEARRDRRRPQPRPEVLRRERPRPHPLRQRGQLLAAVGVRREGSRGRFRPALRGPVEHDLAVGEPGVPSALLLGLGDRLREEPRRACGAQQLEVGVGLDAVGDLHARARGRVADGRGEALPARRRIDGVGVRRALGGAQVGDDRPQRLVGRGRRVARVRSGRGAAAGVRHAREVVAGAHDAARRRDGLGQRVAVAQRDLDEDRDEPRSLPRGGRGPQPGGRADQRRRQVDAGERRSVRARSELRAGRDQPARAVARLHELELAAARPHAARQLVPERACELASARRRGRRHARRRRSRARARCRA